MSEQHPSKLHPLTGQPDAVENIPSLDPSTATPYNPGRPMEIRTEGSETRVVDPAAPQELSANEQELDQAMAADLDHDPDMAKVEAAVAQMEAEASGESKTVPSEYIESLVASALRDEMLPVNTERRHLARQLLSEMITSEREQAIYSFAYIEKIETLLHRMNVTVNAILLIAEALKINISLVVTDDTNKFVQRTIQVAVKPGLKLRTEQLSDVAHQILVRLAHHQDMHQENADELISVTDQLVVSATEIAALRKRIEEMSAPVERPSLPFLENFFVLYYRDRKGRDYFIGLDDSDTPVPVRERKFQNSFHWTEEGEAFRALRAIIQEKLVPHAERFEIVRLSFSSAEQLLTERQQERLNLARERADKNADREAAE